jgi:hypothetical protein
MNAPQRVRYERPSVQGFLVGSLGGVPSLPVGALTVFVHAMCESLALGVAFEAGIAA